MSRFVRSLCKSGNPVVEPAVERPREMEATAFLSNYWRIEAGSTKSHRVHGMAGVTTDKIKAGDERLTGLTL